MTHVLTVINQKGGVGKTATATNLAYHLNANNKTVVLIDLDPSANASRVYVQSTPEITVRDFLLRKDVCQEALTPCKIRGKAKQFFGIIPSTIKLALSHKEIASRLYREQILDKKIKQLRAFSERQFAPIDYIIVDCAPTLSDLTINAIVAANFLLIPVKYEKDALEGVADLWDVIDAVKEPDPCLIRILRNGFDARKRTVNKYINEQLEDFVGDGTVLETIIPQDETINKAKIEDMPVAVFDKRSNAAVRYADLSLEIERMFDPCRN